MKAVAYPQDESKTGVGAAPVPPQGDVGAGGAVSRRGLLGLFGATAAATVLPPLPVAAVASPVWIGVDLGGPSVSGVGLAYAGQGYWASIEAAQVRFMAATIAALPVSLKAPSTAARSPFPVNVAGEGGAAYE